MTVIIASISSSRNIAEHVELHQIVGGIPRELGCAGYPVNPRHSYTRYLRQTNNVCNLLYRILKDFLVHLGIHTLDHHYLCINYNLNYSIHSIDFLCNYLAPNC